MSRPRVVVVGSSNTDMVVRLPVLPAPGETVLGGEFYQAAGGKGANQAVAAARLGAEVRLVARVGDDSLGREAVRRFQAEGILTDAVVVDPEAASGVALIMVDARGENMIAVASGANRRLSPADVDAVAEHLPGSVLLVQLEIPLETVERAVTLAWNAGAPVILNPAPACPLPDALLRQVSILTPNEGELAVLAGRPVHDPETARLAAASLLERDVNTVIVTLGAQGALLVDSGGSRLEPARRVEAVDTTAAGDAFNGALAWALAGGAPLAEAVRLANRAASISVTRPGAQPSLATRRELEELS
ncbi:MAG: ribokinase [Acidobacteriota bacterium]